MRVSAGSPIPTNYPPAYPHEVVEKRVVSIWWVGRVRRERVCVPSLPSSRPGGIFTYIPPCELPKLPNPSNQLTGKEMVRVGNTGNCSEDAYPRKFELPARNGGPRP